MTQWCYLRPLPVLLFYVAVLSAQMHKVEKPERVTRAIGVYEWTGDLNKPTAARLVPVSLFLDGHFEDAGVYLARPVPFTLQTGDVYSVEKAGLTEGTLDLEFARNIVTRRSAEDDNPVGVWYGYGHFAPPEAPKPDPRLKASAHVPAIMGGDVPGDDTPHFVRRSDSSSTSQSTAPAPSGSSSAGVPAVDDDPERPTLRHRDPKQEEARKKQKKESGSGVSGVGDLNNDPDRPTLRRGIPESEVIAPQLSGLPPNLHQAVAVSDPAEHEPHPFAREWVSSSERTQVMQALEALARPKIAAYLAQNRLLPVRASGPSFVPKPPQGNTAGSRPAVKAAADSPAFTLANEELKGYTLTYGGLPTFVYTAETPLQAGGPVYLTMAAQQLPTGEIQVGLLNVTDATHMDRVPWMRPVDVVDPDWSHRGSLLMELRAQSSRQFALYRLVTAQAEQTFVTGVIE